MKRLALLLLLCVAPLWAQEVPLEVKGETIVVVKKLPFLVTAPAGHALYFWTLPPGVVATDKGNVLEVTAAPNGLLKISLKSLVIDWEAKKFEQRFGSVMFGVGDIAPPEPPVPPGPEPTDVIWQPLKAAWSQEADPGKGSQKTSLANLYQQAVTTATDKDIKTVLQLKEIVKTARLSLIGESLPVVRQVLNDESDRVLPKTIDATLDVAARDLCGKTFKRYTDLLRRLP